MSLKFEIKFGIAINCPNSRKNKIKKNNRNIVSLLIFPKIPYTSYLVMLYFHLCRLHYQSHILDKMRFLYQHIVMMFSFQEAGFFPAVTLSKEFGNEIFSTEMLLGMVHIRLLTRFRSSSRCRPRRNVRLVGTEASRSFHQLNFTKWFQMASDQL